VGAADRLCPRLGHTEMLYLAFPDEILNRSSDILDRHVQIDAVLIEQVNRIDP
jgi:hypothetical protein